MTSSTLRVTTSDDATEAFAACRDLFLSDPVAHNVPLTVLENRMASPSPGRYCWVADGESVIGFAWQSPPSFPATVTATTRAGARALADAMIDVGADLPGVIGEAGSAAAFAGRWTERTDTGAITVEGQRVYRLDHVEDVPTRPGCARPAGPADLDLLVTWTEAFADETGDRGMPDVAAAIRDLTTKGLLWVWDDEGVVAMTKTTAPAGGVVRVGLVYTPVDRRGTGYATALVADLSRRLLADGADACILYTQLSNAGSNRVYRRIGYRSVAEVVSYRFE